MSSVTAENKTRPVWCGRNAHSLTFLAFFSKIYAEAILKNCIFAISISYIMKAKGKYINYIVLLFCTVLMFALGSCKSSKSTAHTPTKYHRVRTKHQPHWNATTSPNTTYYIKKHSTRKSHDSKKVKR